MPTGEDDLYTRSKRWLEGWLTGCQKLLRRLESEPKLLHLLI
jgi:hypothetical protein